MDEYIITEPTRRRSRRSLPTRLLLRLLRVLATALLLVARAVERAIREPLLWLLLAAWALHALSRHTGP